VLLASASAEAATPTYYADLPSFQADITSTVTDDYSNPGYVFIQNNAVMSAVIGETDYMSTGFNDLNIVSGGYYCAGCNGSFQLSFQTTSVGTPAGVEGAGALIQTHSLATPYFAYITFGDGTTENVQLPPAGTFWGVSAVERIVSIHFGLTMGGTTQGGSFGIDNLIVGDGQLTSDCCTPAVMGADLGCTDPTCEAAVCAIDPDCCNVEWDASCAAQAFTTCDVLCSDCGDGLTTGDEQCDDAGESATCDDDCTFVACGDDNANMAAGEDCDDGGVSATCDADCTAAVCGDATLNMLAGEICDDGGRSATCNVDCTLVSCGDGVVNMTAGEECDDVEESATCNADCTLAVCGDGFVNVTAGEDCDDGGGQTATCDADCTEAHCPDGVLNELAGEECDDGNIINGDGCNFQCLLEAVGSTGGDTGGDSSGGGESTGGGTAADGTAGDADSGGDSGGVTTGNPTTTTITAGGDDSSTGIDTDGTGSGTDDGCNCSTSGGREDAGRGLLWSVFGLLGLTALRRRRRG
jgi:MYXO-CTERM domain-containing protein